MTDLPPLPWITPDDMPETGGDGWEEPRPVFLSTAADLRDCLYQSEPSSWASRTTVADEPKSGLPAILLTLTPMAASGVPFTLALTFKRHGPLIDAVVRYNELVITDGAGSASVAVNGGWFASQRDRRT